MMLWVNKLKGHIATKCLQNDFPAGLLPDFANTIGWSCSLARCFMKQRHCGLNLPASASTSPQYGLKHSKASQEQARDTRTRKRLKTHTSPP
eukprot:5551729-Amphidinium_carterae.1